MRILVVVWRTLLLLALELAVLWACGRGQPESAFAPAYPVIFSALVIFFFAIVTTGRSGEA